MNAGLVSSATTKHHGSSFGNSDSCEHHALAVHDEQGLPRKDPPPATQEGKGTIGCYINGKPWVPKPYIAIGVPHYLEVVFDESRNNFFGLEANKDGSFAEQMNIYVQNASLGRNTIIRFNAESFYNSNKGNNCFRYYLDTTTRRLSSYQTQYVVAV